MKLEFEVPAEVIQDGTAGLVEVGDTGAWRLCFAESPDDAPGSANYEFTAAPRGPESAGGSVPVELNAGWFSAFWPAPARIEGDVHLHGYLYCDLLYGGAVAARGTVTSLKAIVEIMYRGPGGRHDWRRSGLELRPLSALPRTLDDGLVRGEERHPGVFAAVRPDPWRHERGILVGIESV